MIKESNGEDFAMFDFIKKLLKKTTKAHMNKKAISQPVKKSMAYKPECSAKKQEKQTSKYAIRQSIHKLMHE